MLGPDRASSNADNADGASPSFALAVVGPISSRSRRLRPRVLAASFGSVITEHPTAEGPVYIAVVVDALNRRVVGLAIADHPPGCWVRLGSIGDCFDNALCEAFLATLQTKLDRRTWRPGPNWPGDLRVRRAVRQPDPPPVGPRLPQPRR
jgi:hypothetical protein